MNYRMGASLEGAYLLWDDLLLTIPTQQRTFLPILLDQLLNAVTRQTNTQAQFDADKDALSQWLLHLAYSPVWRSRSKFIQFDSTSHIMSHCCLHPGSWSRILGEKMLEADGSNDLADMWSDLLSASAVAVDDTSAQSKPVGLDLTAEQSLGMVGMDDIMSNDQQETASWRRAIFAPTAPIGVV
jgi:ribosomal biogenesis protein LAS1